jgi:hypothetical protein
MVNKIKHLANRDDFVNQLIKNALDAKLDLKAVSKWGLFTEQVANNPIHLEGYSEQLKKDIREFKGCFSFKADE